MDREERRDREDGESVSPREEGERSEQKDDPYHVAPVIPPVFLELDDGNHGEAKSEGSGPEGGSCSDEREDHRTGHEREESEHRSHDRIGRVADQHQDVGEDPEDRLMHGSDPAGELGSGEIGEVLGECEDRVAVESGVVAIGDRRGEISLHPQHSKQEESEQERADDPCPACICSASGFHRELE